MTLNLILLIFSTLLCSLVAGFLFAFAVVAMPGIRNLGNRQFLEAFKVMDRVIQNNQPIFMIVWIGSVLAIVATAVSAIWQLEGADRLLIFLASASYLFGVQAPTARINIPLNNHLQSTDLDSLSESEIAETREGFEPRWNRWNGIRTVFAVLTSALLIVVLAGV